MKTIRIVLILALSAGLFFLSCKEKESEKLTEVEFSVPSAVTIDSDATTMDFKVLFNHPPKTSDQIILEDQQGTQHTCQITSVDDSKFTIKLPSQMSSGTYKVYLSSGGEKTLKGSMTVTVAYAPTPGDVVTPEGASIYGQVTCAGTPMEGVVLSDGVDVVKTNSDGVYRIKSDKKYGYVFITLPSGYETTLTGIIPDIWKPVTKGSSASERVDFQLTKVNNDSFTLYVMGDMHLAKKQNDINQFRDYMGYLQEDINSGSGRQYGLTLGDMTWDIYWYSHSYGFTEYKEEINRDLGRICLWHTMGNHDNDYRQVGDFLKEDPYRDAICPTFYSFNLGKFHFVVLDNIDYKNAPASIDNASGTITTDHRSEYVTDFTAEQMEWLKKDLAFVDKSTPIIMSSHAPAYRPNGATGSKAGLTAHADGTGDYGTAAFRAVIAGYNVHFFSGHTHNHFAYDDTANGFYETNGGAVCGTWWWSGYYTTGFNLSQDGTPGGYTVCTVNGNDIKWQYRTAGADPSYQFRSYDMNEVKKVLTDGLGNDAAGWKTMVASTNSFANNTVLLNVWAYDKSWKISVTENGKELDVTPVTAYDPLHMLAMSAPRYRAGSTTFVTSNWSHFFLVQTTSETSTLDIKVTDRFGNVYSETMTRPKVFGTANYKYKK